MAGLFSSIPRRSIDIPFDEEASLAYESERNSEAEGDESYNQLVDFLRQNANVREQTEQNIAFSTLLDYLRNNSVESDTDADRDTDGDITQRIIYAPELAPTGGINIINGVPYDFRNGELVPISPEDFNSEESWFEAVYNRAPHQRIYTLNPNDEILYDCFPLDSSIPTRGPNPCNEIFIRARGHIDFNASEITIKGVDENTLNKFKEPESLRKEDYTLVMPVKSCDAGSILSYIYKESGESKDES